MFGKLVQDAGYVGGQGEKWTECLLDDLTQSFRNQCRPVDDCSPGRGGRMAKDGGTRGAESFMGETDHCREKARAGLRRCSIL